MAERGRVRATFTSKEDLQTVVERALREWRERHREFDAATDVDLVPATNDPRGTWSS